MCVKPTEVLRRVGHLMQTWRRILGAFLPYTYSYRRPFVFGVCAALAVVAIRLSIPIVFHKMLEPWLTGGVEPSEPVAYWVQFAVLGSVVGGLFIALGFADHFERLQFARFAIGVVRDLRGAASERFQCNRPDRESGDLIARLIGDTARMKAGIRGFLVHVATNGLLYAGAAIILLVTNVYLGSLFVVAGLTIAMVTCVGAAVVFDLALQHRTREGRLALSLERQVSGEGKVKTFDKQNRRSGRIEAAVTKAQGRTTWMAHGIYGLAIILALWFGATAVPTDSLSASDLFMFLLYALMLRAPTVQLSRQGARSGKILACAVRVHELLSNNAGRNVVPRLAPLHESMRLTAVKIKASDGRTKARIGKIDLVLNSGERLLLIGAPGSGKTTLLKILLGELRPTQGQITWDNVVLNKADQFALAELISYCGGSSAQWSRQRLGQWLDPSQETALVNHVLELCGATSIIRNLPDGLMTKIASDQLSSGERASLSLVKAVLNWRSILLLDDPLQHVSNVKKQRILQMIMSHHPAKTVVYATRKFHAPDLFHRVLYLQKGKLKDRESAGQSSFDRGGSDRQSGTSL